MEPYEINVGIIKNSAFRGECAALTIIHNEDFEQN